MQHHKRHISVLLTAGHAATTALATIEALRLDTKNEWDISWIGPKKAIEGTSLKPFELDVFPSMGVHVYSITAGKLQTKFTRQTIPAILKIPIGFVSSIRLLLTIKPEIVLSFGGFAAVPVVIAASLLRIPVVLHEQTVAAGLANRITGFFAKKIALARGESVAFFPKHKCVVVGNPLMQEVLTTKTKEKLSEPPVVFITGGSRGAQRVNDIVFATITELLSRYKVIHLTGQLDYSKAIKVREALPAKLKNRYETFAFVNPLQIGTLYKEASIVVGRAGANTVSEVMALSIPSIFIPIPWARADEQTKNAQLAERSGGSILLPEAYFSSKTLLTTLAEVTKNWRNMKESARAFTQTEMDRNAATRVVTLLSDILS